MTTTINTTTTIDGGTATTAVNILVVANATTTVDTAIDAVAPVVTTDVFDEAVGRLQKIEDLGVIRASLEAGARAIAARIKGVDQHRFELVNQLLDKGVFDVEPIDGSCSCNDCGSRCGERIHYVATLPGVVTVAPMPIKLSRWSDRDAFFFEGREDANDGWGEEVDSPLVGDGETPDEAILDLIEDEDKLKEARRRLPCFANACGGRVGWFDGDHPTCCGNCKA